MKSAVDRNASWLVLAGVLSLAGCPTPEPKPLPGGPPPEYEAPRSYDPRTDIDGAKPPVPDEDEPDPTPAPAPVPAPGASSAPPPGVPAKPEPTLPDEDEEPEE